MSEWPEEAAPRPVREFPARPAAAVVLVRGGGGDPEVFWVRRGNGVSHGAGFHAFPGGRLDPDDERSPVDGAEGKERGLAVCAVRELFEETGLLFARPADPAGHLPPPERIDALRKELLGGVPFGALLAREGLVADARGLVPAGRWVSPPFIRSRFDALFFLVRSTEGDHPRVLPGELASGEWIRPSEALRRWGSGEALLHPPALHIVATLAAFPFETAVGRLRRPPYQGADGISRRIEIQRGVIPIALRTPTLPPATTTSCWVVGTGELAVVDPGSPWQEEIDRLLGFLDELVSEGRRVRAVLLTHHHRDHVGAAGAVARRFGVPIRASGETAERIPGAVGDLEDGTPIPLDGPLPMTLRPLRTDGHAPGHLVFLEERSRGLFTGDLVANGSTILIDPPEGNLDDYLASLERVRALPLGALFPAHGLVMPEGRAEIEALLEHRRERIRQVEGLLARGGTGAVEAIVEEFYAGTPAELRPFAARSAQATLEHLERRGRAEREPRGGWRLAGERKTEGAP